MTKEINTLNLANALVMRAETKYLGSLLTRYEDLQRQRGADAQMDIVLNLITKEKARLSPCDKYDQEEVQIALLVKKRRNAG